MPPCCSCGSRPILRTQQPAIWYFVSEMASRLIPVLRARKKCFIHPVPSFALAQNPHLADSNNSISNQKPRTYKSRLVETLKARLYVVASSKDWPVLQVDGRFMSQPVMGTTCRGSPSSPGESLGMLVSESGRPLSCPYSCWRSITAVEASICVVKNTHLGGWWGIDSPRAAKPCRAPSSIELSPVNLPGDIVVAELQRLYFFEFQR
ncbi:hypothetical protein V8B97DRAFT_1216203 [Scleroderma yunnanense]